MSARSLAPAQEALSSRAGPFAGAVLRRKCACGNRAMNGPCEKCKASTARLQREPAREPSAAEAPSIVNEVLRSRGEPLDATTRTFFEARFGHDFSRVRVHTDGQAAESSRAVNALAYTVGNDVAFDRGQYAPRTARGNALLAHELAHVVQQSRAPSALAQLGGLWLGDDNDPLEGEADRSAMEVLSGRAGSRKSRIRETRLQRQPAGNPAPKPRDTHAQSTRAADITSPRAHTTSNYGLGVFESDLRSFAPGSPCLLTLRLNLSFDFVDTPAGFSGSKVTGTPTRRSWSPAEQNSWTSAFVRAVTSRWSYRYPLVVTNAADPNCLWASGVCDRAMARVEVIPVVSGADATVHVTRSPSDYRARAGYGNAYVTQADIKPDADGQVAVEHEFGHLLGLDHSNPACKSTAAGPAANAGRDECYVGTPEQTADIMGSGSIVTPQDYAPFVQEMNYYTNPCTWRTEGAAPSPPSRPFGHAGLVTGSIVGAAGGAIIGGILGSGGPLGAGGGAVLGGLVGLAGGMLVGAIADVASS
jgi:hypothetical protein